MSHIEIYLSKTEFNCKKKYTNLTNTEQKLEASSISRNKIQAKSSETSGFDTLHNKDNLQNTV